MKDYVSGVIEHSGKMVILMEIIEQCVTLHEKILIFRYFFTTVCSGIPACGRLEIIDFFTLRLSL